MKHIDRPRERNTTQLDPNYTAAYGCKELHTGFFTPKDDAGGRRGVVAVQIPETTNDLFAHAMRAAIARNSRSWLAVV